MADAPSPAAGLIRLELPNAEVVEGAADPKADAPNIPPDGLADSSLCDAEPKDKPPNPEPAVSSAMEASRVMSTAGAAAGACGVPPNAETVFAPPKALWPNAEPVFVEPNAPKPPVAVEEKAEGVLPNAEVEPPNAPNPPVDLGAPNGEVV